MILNVEKLTMAGVADKQSVETWRDSARIEAKNALYLANDPAFDVFAVRNSRGTLVGVVAGFVGLKGYTLAHLGTRDAGLGVGSLLVKEISKVANGKPIKTTPAHASEGFYQKLGWRKIGNEFWSK